MIDDHDQHRDYQVASETIMHKTPSPASNGHENASMFVLQMDINIQRHNYRNMNLAWR